MTLKLLVADDSETIQKMIGLAFDETDTIVEFASSGDTALDGIRARRPDIVLADVCLPDINGYEICARIKENPELAHIPVVLLVGTFEPFDEAEASRVGSTASLTKPFDTSELIDVVQKQVGRDIMQPENVPESTFSSGESDAPNDAVLSDRVSNTGIPVSRQTWDSFLGNGRVLDIFDAAAVAEAKHTPGKESAPLRIAGTAGGASTETMAISADQLSDEALDKIVRKVVEKMSTDIISEIAWEVVPELSEILIRRSIEEGKSG